MNYKLRFTPIVLNRMLKVFSDIDIKDIPFTESTDKDGQLEDAKDISYIVLSKLGIDGMLLNEVFQNITNSEDDFSTKEVPELVDILSLFFSSCGSYCLKLMKKIREEKMTILTRVLQENLFQGMEKKETLESLGTSLNK